MFFQLLVVVATVPIVGAILMLVGTVIRTVAARRQLEERGAGLKIADGFSVWAGHVNSFLFREGQMYTFDAWSRRLNAKTIGWLYGYRKAALSADLDLIKRVVLDHQESERIAFELPVEEMQFDCIMTASGDQWRRLRRAFAPALKSNKFNTPNVRREIDQSIGKLVKAIESKLEASEQNQIELNIDDYAHRYSLDLVFSCFFKQNELVDFNARVDPLTQFMDSNYATASCLPVRLCVIFPILRPIVAWLSTHFHQYGEFRRTMANYIKRTTKLGFEARKHLEELKRTSGRIPDEDNFTLPDGTKFSRNMMDHLADQFYEGKLTKTEYFHSSFAIVGAADKTTCDAIVHALYQLATHAEVQEKLRKSILAEGVDSEYLSWTIKESLRMLPPVPVACSRMTSRDYECQDGVVPAGTFLTIATYSVHRLEEFWGPDANEFKPERFASAKGFHPLQFIPFGGAAHVCPGRYFAIHEMKKLLCGLLTRYKFQCEPLELSYNSPFYSLQLPNEHVYAKISRV